MSDMLVRYDGSYVVSVSGSGIVVVGGAGGEHLNDVQVFDGESHTWHRGTLPFSSLTVQCDVKDVVFSKEEGGHTSCVWSKISVDWRCEGCCV